MDAKLKIQNYHGQFIGFVKVEGFFDYTQVRINTIDYYNRPTGSISVFATKDEVRKAAFNFAQRKINQTAASS